jgi:hypothetical protein
VSSSGDGAAVLGPQTRADTRTQLDAVPAQVVELWTKYEEIAMHFNDLMMRWRLQAVGGLATLITISGFVVGDATTFAVRYRAMLILSGTLAVVWLGVAIIDLFYYRKLLRGAIDGILRLETLTPEIQLSTVIEDHAACGGRWAPWVFYLCAFLPLVGVVAWALWNLLSLPPEGGTP